MSAKQMRKKEILLTGLLTGGLLTSGLFYLLNKVVVEAKAISEKTEKTVIYDLGANYIEKSYAFEAWKYKGLWTELPAGFTGSVTNDVAVKTNNFYLYLHSTQHDAAFTFPNHPDNFGKGEEMYSIYTPTPSGYTIYGGNSQRRKVYVNTDMQKRIHSISYPTTKPDGIWTVGISYTFFKNYNWMKIEGHSENGVVAANRQGCHGETRFIVLPNVPHDKVDMVYDSKYFPTIPEYNWTNIELSEMILNFYIASDSLVMFTYTEPTYQQNGLEYGRYSWNGGWSYVEEEAYGDTDGSIYGIWAVMHTNLPCYYSILNGQWKHRYWNYMGVKQTLDAGTVFKDFRVVFNRSPMYNQAWRPAVMGIWRINAKVGNTIFTQEVDVKKPEDLFFLMPKTDVLEYVLCYLYDRNDLTPTNIATPMDVYMETRGK